MQLPHDARLCRPSPAASRAPAIDGWRLWNAATLTCAALLWTVAAGQAQTCLHGADESSDQRARRTAAIRFIQQVTDAQERVRLETRKFARLDELSGIDAPPVGFVPKLMADDWSYSIVLKDFFDECRLILFSDQDRVIYEGYPLTTARRRLTSGRQERSAPTVKRGIERLP